MTEPVGDKGTESPEVPRSLLVARWLWIASALVGIVRTVIQAADRNMLLEQLRRVAPELTLEELDTAANGQIMFALLMAVLSVAVYVLLAQRMVQGRPWARAVLAVFGGFTVVGTILTLSMVIAIGLPMVRQLTDVPIGLSDLVIVTASAVLSGVALVFMFRPDAKAFFREQRSVSRTRPNF